MKKYILPALFSFLVLGLSSCSNDFNHDVSDEVVEPGTADFSKYIALGNSLTSGFRDNALYISGQKESYPAMIAEQMKRAGGGEFKIPLMADELGGIPQVGVANKMGLVVVNGSLAPSVLTGTGTTTLANIYSEGPYQNMGVPGAKSFHLVAPGYGNPANLATKTANPYFVRFASSPNTTVLADAMAQNPTFFSLWIGNNDVLGYATSGGDGSNEITKVSTFQGAYTALIQGLTSNGAKGIVANLPYVTNIPFFTTVPSTPFAANQFTAQQVAALNAAYHTYNLGLDQIVAAHLITAEEAQKRKIVFVEGKVNGAVIADKDLTDLSGMGLPSIRMSAQGDLLLLPVSSILKTGGGTSVPLEDKYVLTAKEVGNLTEATNQFNSIIKNIADQYNLAFADINKLMADLNNQSGITYDGVNYSNTFVTGGAFSLDGVHPTGRGYAFIANEFIKAINKKYGSSLVQVNPNIYQGVTFP